MISIKCQPLVLIHISAYFTAFSMTLRQIFQWCCDCLWFFDINPRLQVAKKEVWGGYILLALPNTQKGLNPQWTPLFDSLYAAAE